MFSFSHVLSQSFCDLISSVLLFQFYRSKDWDSEVYNNVFNISQLINVRIGIFLTLIPVVFLMLITFSHVENLYM